MKHKTKLKTYSYRQSVDSDRWLDVGSINVEVVTTSVRKAIEIMMTLPEIERYATVGWVRDRLNINREMVPNRTPNVLYVYKVANREGSMISWCKPKLIKMKS